MSEIVGKRSNIPYLVEVNHGKGKGWEILGRAKGQEPRDAICQLWGRISGTSFPECLDSEAKFRVTVLGKATFHKSELR